MNFAFIPLLLRKSRKELLFHLLKSSYRRKADSKEGVSTLKVLQKNTATNMGPAIKLFERNEGKLHNLT